MVVQTNSFQKRLFAVDSARTWKMSIAAVVFAGLAVCLYGLSWNSTSAGFLSDDAVYLMMADAFSPFRPSDPELTGYVMRQTLFPPLYPLLLAMLGAGSTFLLWAHQITTTTLVLALGVYGRWIHAETKDTAAALGLVVLFALLPGTLLHDMELLSELPYIFFSLAAVCVASRSPITQRSAGLVAFFAGLATLTRSAGLSLFVALGIWLYRNRVQGWMKWLVFALAPNLLWLAYKTWVLGNHGGYQGFWVWLLNQFEHNDPVEFVPMFLWNQASGIWLGLLGDLDLRPSLLAKAVLGCTLIAAVPAWTQRLRQWRLDAWYLLVGGGMTFLYPFPTFFNRLILPWIPIVFFYAYLGVVAATKRWGQLRERPAVAYAYLVILFLAIVPSLAFMAQRFATPLDPDVAATWKHTRYWYRVENMVKINADVAFRQSLIHAAGELGQWVPRGECVFSVHTAIAMLYGKRIVQQPPAPGVDTPEFERLSRSCQYFFLLSTGGTIGGDHVEPLYPYDRLSGSEIEVVHSWPDSRNPSAPVAILLHVKPQT